MTWNINSVPLCLPLLLRLIKKEQPDVICLQETKCPDDLFPREAITQLGYHLHIHGMKGYNGVAILSRVPIKDPQIYTRAGKQDCRHIAGNVGGMTIHNLYIPAGGDIPDTMINDKFAHKLQVVDELARFFKRTHGPQDRVMACGDFNIAPHEHDVWSHRQLIDVVSHTPIEVEKLARMQKSLSWIDVARHACPPGYS